MSIKTGYFSKPFEKFYLLNTDITSIYRPHSPSLPQRRYVYQANNKIKGNSPVQEGYELSCVGLSSRCPLYGVSEAAWNPPLSLRLVPAKVNKNSFTAVQVNDLMDNKDLPFHKDLTVNTLDSSYCSPEYVVDTYGQTNLVNIIRIRSNRTVWKQLTPEEVAAKRASNTDKRGADSVYGQECKLPQVDNWELDSDIGTSFGIKLGNGKKVLVEVEVWENMMIRSQRGKSMKNKPFRLVRIRLLNAETGKALFKRPMWLCVWGERRMELTVEEIYWAYRNRYDIEHFFRFGKQKLLLDKYQTPDEDHLQNWMEVVNLSYWLLFVGKNQASHESSLRKWQQYDSNYKNRIQYDSVPTPSQVQNQLEAIILEFEQEPFLPKPQKKGKGRQVGQTQVKRKKFPVLKKKKKQKKHKKKT